MQNHFVVADADGFVGDDDEDYPPQEDAAVVAFSFDQSVCSLPVKCI
jgi:hypothetical protein